MNNPRVWGIGAYWLGDKDGPDKTRTFVNGGYAEIGWNSDEAPALYEMFNRIEKDDIIYIKSFPPGKKLRIKAIGWVLEKPELNKVRVKWLYDHCFIHELSEKERKYNIYGLTFYEELNPTIRWEVKQRITSDVIRSPLL